MASEAPLINGRFGAAYTRGLQQGEDAARLKVVVTLKHWAAYSLENSDGWRRYNFSANVSQYALQTTYFPAFRMAVQQGGAKGVMCSYNAGACSAPRGFAAVCVWVCVCVGGGGRAGTLVRSRPIPLFPPPRVV